MTTDATAPAAPADPTTGSPAGISQGTVTPAAPKPAKVTGKLTLLVEYTTDVDEAKEYSKGIVKSLRDAGLTVKAEFAETVPSKKAL